MESFLDKPQPISMEEFRSSFHTEVIKDNEVHELAVDMQRELSRYFNVSMNLQPKRLDLETFRSIYDPDLPTIAVDPDHTYSGSELLGIASHEDGLRANIVYVSTEIRSTSILSDAETGASQLQVQSGAMVLPNGQVAYGDFPIPVAADIIETADLAIIEQCEAHGVASFHSSKNMRNYNDKNLLESLSNNAHTYTPQRIDEDTLMAMSVTDNLVIKPSKQSQGRGVLLTDNDADADHTKRFYTYLKDKGYEPIVEERARSFKINSPENGERLDWNVRALLSYGELVGMYVRADLWGGPVNMSLSAGAISMDDFARYFQNPNDAWRVMDVLRDSAQAVAEENPSSLIGVDLTVDEDMKACLFEINNGHTGGLQTIAKLEGTYDDKMDVTRKVLKKFIKHAPSKQATIEDDSNAVPLEPSFSVVARKAYYGRLHEQLASLDIKYVPDNDDERFGTVLALAAIHTSIHRMLRDHDGFTEAGERLMRQYPLESRRHVIDMFIRLDRPAKRDTMVSYLSEYADIFPDDFEAIGLQSALAAGTMDLKSYKQMYELFKEKSEDNAAHFYAFASNSFEKRFGSLTRDLDEHDRDDFHRLIEGAVSTYCEFGYDDADTLLTRKLESVGAENSMSRLVRSLQAVIAFGDQRVGETFHYAYFASHDFDETYEFYEHVLDSLLPMSADELAGNTVERLEFLTKMNMTLLGGEFTIPMTIDYMRQSDVVTSTRDQIINTMAELTALDHTPEEQNRMVEVLKNASNADTAAADDRMPELNGVSDYGIFTLLIEHLYAGNRHVAMQLVKELGHVESMSSGLDCIVDAYITNPDVDF